MRVTRMFRVTKDLSQRINKQCGRWGHDWVYTPNGMKSCSRLHCNRVAVYTPNQHGRRVFE